MKSLPLKFVFGIVCLAPALVMSPIRAQAQAADPAQTEAKIEDGSPKAGLRDFFVAARKGDASKLETMWSAPGDDEKETVKPTTDAIVAVSKLDQKVKEKFNDTSSTSFAKLPDDSEIAAGKEETKGDVHVIKSADASKPWESPMVKTDGQWKLSMAATMKSGSNTPKDTMKTMLKGMSTICDQVSADIDSGKIKSSKEAKSSMQAGMMKIAMESMQKNAPAAHVPAPATQKN